MVSGLGKLCCYEQPISRKGCGRIQEAKVVVVEMIPSRRLLGVKLQLLEHQHVEGEWVMRLSQVIVLTSFIFSQSNRRIWNDCKVRGGCWWRWSAHSFWSWESLEARKVNIESYSKLKTAKWHCHPCLETCDKEIIRCCARQNIHNLADLTTRPKYCFKSPQ